MKLYSSALSCEPNRTHLQQSHRDRIFTLNLLIGPLSAVAAGTSCVFRTNSAGAGGALMIDLGSRKSSLQSAIFEGNYAR